MNVGTNTGSGVDTGATSRVGYPSVVAPGLPAFTLTVPEGWQVGEFPDALMAVLAPVETGEFRPNLVVQGRRVAPSVTLDAVARGIEADLAGIYGDVDVRRREWATDDGAELLEHTYFYRAPDGTDLVHRNVTVLLHDEVVPGGFRSLLGINVVCGRLQWETWRPHFESMITSFEVERRYMSDQGGLSDAG